MVRLALGLGPPLVVVVVVVLMFVLVRVLVGRLVLEVEADRQVEVQLVQDASHGDGMALVVGSE